MVSFPEINPTFDNERDFDKPSWDHPYWLKNFVSLQTYGFSREYLVSLAELDELQGGRITMRFNIAIKALKRDCLKSNDNEEGRTEELLLGEIETPKYEPEYIANALMRKRGTYPLSGTVSDAAPNLMTFLIEAEEFDEEDFCMEFYFSYHPDNRFIMPFESGVRSDGMIVDADGPTQFHPKYVDERGKLLDLYFKDHK